MDNNTNIQNHQEENNDDEKLSPLLVEKFLEVQEAQLKIQAQENELKGREMELNANIALKQMEYNAAFLSKNPKQLRFNFLVIGSITIVALLIIAIFIFELLEKGKDGIANTIILAITHMVVAYFSYRAGKKLGKSSGGNDDFNKSGFEEI